MIIESAQPYAQHPPTATEPAPAVLDSDKHRLIHAAVTNTIAKPQINAVSAVPLSIARVDNPQPGQPFTMAQTSSASSQEVRSTHAY